MCGKWGQHGWSRPNEVSKSPTLLNLDMRLGNHLAPKSCLFRKEFCRVRRRADHRLRGEPGEAFGDLRRSQGVDNIVVDLVRQRRGRGGRRDEGEPGDRTE